MSLRSRIEALDNRWDKEADDILQEILDSLSFNGKWIDLRIERCGGGNNNSDGWVKVETCKDGESDTFHFTDQCSKMQAFKDALLWLLEKSGLESHKPGDKIKIKIESEGKTYQVKILKEE